LPSSESGRLKSTSSVSATHSGSPSELSRAASSSPCSYTATVEGNTLGGPILKASDGRDVKNLLFTYEGCFDTTESLIERNTFTDLDGTAICDRWCRPVTPEAAGSSDRSKSGWASPTIERLTEP